MRDSVDDTPDRSAIESLFERVVTINIGLRAFKDALEAQEAEMVHVDWHPPAGGDEELLRILDSLL